MVYTDITVQEILEIRHSQFDILTDNLISLFNLLMLDGREFHRFVPEYRKVLLKYSLFGRGTCKLFNIADLKPYGQFSLIQLNIEHKLLIHLNIRVCFMVINPIIDCQPF